MGVLLLADEQQISISKIKRKFRGYSKATAGGGAIIDSTKGGGGTTRSTTSGGSVSKSTASGGGSTQTSSSGGGTSTSTSSGGGVSKTTSNNNSISVGVTAGPLPIDGVIPDYHNHVHQINPQWFTHTHNISIASHTHGFSTPNHSHTVAIPTHTHSFEVPSHSHDVVIPSHTHEIELPNHTHEVKHEIVELDSLPTSVSIKVDGNTVPHTGLSAERLNIVDYLDKDEDGKIRRGKHKVEIFPSSLARIEADLIARVFIQSDLGGNY